MHAALKVSSVLAALLAAAYLHSDDDNGAWRWGDSWIAYGGHETARPGTRGGAGARRAGGGGLSDCHPIPGAHGILYVQCDSGPQGQQNLFEGVVPDDPADAAVTPGMLLEQALRQLKPSAPRVATAPPRGKDGLVGLRHYFWVERSQWRVISERATAGSVWAEVMAKPEALVIKPGIGQDAVTCKGPGMPFEAATNSADQKNGCSHLFTRSSAGLPGSRYQVTVSIVWSASWTGSGGAGGSLPSITTSTTFPLRIAEGQALIQRSS
ncbi:hypothetical protein JYK22_02205, partial [Nonomuraea sp. RK-328]|nr:hypothetical protein [Nonomuraea sp. RK-328]